jgi:hypothetical protein
MSRVPIAINGFGYTQPSNPVSIVWLIESKRDHQHWLSGPKVLRCRSNYPSEQLRLTWEL